MNDSKCKILWMDYHKPVYVKSDPRYDNINKKCGWWRQSIYFVECLGWECIDISFPIISVYILVEKNEVFCNNIKTFSECEAAAKQLGLSDTTATDDGQNGFDRDPPYCYFESDSLKFNYGGTNTGLCGSNNYLNLKEDFSTTSRHFNWQRQKASMCRLKQSAQALAHHCRHQSTPFIPG